jgi:ribosome recycling factor
MIQDVIKDVQHRMHGAVEALHREFKSLRTGRANAAMLDTVTIDYYGTQTPLAQVASIKVPEPALIVIEPWDKGMVAPIEKAIRTGDLGLNPASDGKVIRVPIPPLTEERRKDLAKIAGKYAEQQRIAVRNVRRDANDDLKKAEKDAVINQDEHKRMEAEVQKLTDEAIKRVDEALKIKEQEIMHV